MIGQQKRKARSWDEVDALWARSHPRGAACDCDPFASLAPDRSVDVKQANWAGDRRDAALGELQLLWSKID